MGQALRRATSRVRSSNLEPPPPPPPKVFDKRPSTAAPIGENRVPTVEPNPTVKRGGGEPLDAPDEISSISPENVLEERDTGYDAMLSQMVGRIKSKPGGKLEMGEAFIVEKYNRPMPKLRNTKPDYSHCEDRPVPAGTLNVAQLKQILLLHQGKAEDHSGPMDIDQIAQSFRIDSAQVQKILQFVSLPPENDNSKKDEYAT